MFKFANNVLSSLSADVGVGVTSISVAAESGINNAPPDPNGGTAVLTLVDNLSSPTKMEIIYYTGKTGVGPYVLTGVLRGRENTVDQSWDTGDFVFQDQTVGALAGGVMNQAVLSESMRVPDGFNAALIGPVSVADGKTLTVGDNAMLVVQ